MAFTVVSALKLALVCIFSVVSIHYGLKWRKEKYIMFLTMQVEEGGQSGHSGQRELLLDLAK